LDGGEGDVEDRLVQDDHQHPGAQHDEGEPAGIAAIGHESDRNR
jgi:hypothetical protein